MSNLFLALAILSFCLLFFKIITNYTGLAGTVSFRYIPNAFELSTGPLIYFYLRALTEKGFKWEPKYILHFLPFFLAQGFAFLIYASVQGIPTVAEQDQVAHSLFYVPIKEFEDWSIVVSISTYLILGYKKFVVFRTLVRNSTSDTAYPTLNWLRVILVLCIVLLIFLVTNMSISRLTTLEQDTSIHWRIYFVYVAAVTYYMSFMSFRQRTPDLSQINLPENPEIKSRASSDEDRGLAKRLIELLEKEKIYLEPTLNARQVAERLEVSQTNLSQVINSQFKKSFRELINDYRIEDVKSKLLDPDNKASILSIALESGFNSEASFYRVFKNKLGVSPKVYIELHG
ncbi:MAG: helix-turn-helix transcriptional regulator [Kangiellaceae bacterium]|nr:helix-turn-helix transcriptional regulator [Kangiellaceae bacterium]MCW9016418.1 helix-turn-helix transcriptional regulator [Kangiellaceae bacterium]